MIYPILNSILFCISLLMTSTTSFALTWEELGTTHPQELDAKVLIPLQTLPLGSHILGQSKAYPFKHLELPNAHLFLGGVKEVSVYQSLQESHNFLAQLTSLKSSDLPFEKLIPQLKTLTQHKTFKNLIPALLQETLFHRITEGAEHETSPIDQEALSRWIGAAEFAIKSLRTEALQAGYPLEQPLLVMNVAKEYAPSGAISVSDIPVQMLRSDEDLLFFLRRPTSNTRVIFAPWVDSERFDLSNDLSTLTHAIHFAHQQGFVVYIHCKHGASRSAALTLDYLLHYAQITPEPSTDEALTLSQDLLPTPPSPLITHRLQITLEALQSIREQVNPNAGFIKTLKRRIDP